VQQLGITRYLTNYDSNQVKLDFTQVAIFSNDIDIMSKNIRFLKDNLGPGHKLYNKMIESAGKTTPKPLVEYERSFLNFMAIFLPNEEDQQVLLTVSMDYIFRLFFMSAVAEFPDEQSLRPENIKKHLKKTTNIRDDDIDRIQQLLKSMLTNRYTKRPKSERKNKIRESHLNCYICGAIIDDEEIEVDHVWPHSLGGGNSGDNLKKAHAACAAIKSDSATSGDALHGSSVYTGHPTGLDDHPHQLSLWPNTIENKNDLNKFNKNLISSSLRMAVIMKQQFKCYSCEQEFLIAGEVTIANDSDKKTSSLLSLRAICPNCE
jgi:5-methylcytosine-specific restriction endonuclease McrA